MTTGTFHTNLAGVSMKNPDGQPRQDYIRMYCRPGMRVELRREPDNRYDSNAVACWISKRVFLFFKVQAQIGYIPAELCGEISRHIANGGHVDCTITEVTGGTRGKPTRGVNAQIRKS